jgi:hypothetical protein
MKRNQQPAEAVAATETFLVALCAFVTQHGGPCYRNWSPETLMDYFRWHLDRGTLSWCRHDGAICGAFVAWPETSARLDAASATGAGVFDWTLPEQPDALFVADVVTTQPGAWQALARALLQRHPHWQPLPVWTYRRKKLVRLTDRLKSFCINLQPPMTGGN